MASSILYSSVIIRPPLGFGATVYIYSGVVFFSPSGLSSSSGGPAAAADLA